MDHEPREKAPQDVVGIEGRESLDPGTHVRVDDIVSVETRSSAPPEPGALDDVDIVEIVLGAPVATVETSDLLLDPLPGVVTGQPAVTTDDLLIAPPPRVDRVAVEGVGARESAPERRARPSFKLPRPIREKRRG